MQKYHKIFFDQQFQVADTEHPQVRLQIEGIGESIMMSLEGEIYLLRIDAKGDTSFTRNEEGVTFINQPGVFHVFVRDADNIASFIASLREAANFLESEFGKEEIVKSIPIQPLNMIPD